MHPPTPAGERISGLDALRGIAILLVLTHHAFASLLPADVRSMSTGFQALVWWTGFGHLGVHLFFVLSGFLISGMLVAHRGDASYYRPFYARRAARILPAYLAMVALLWCSGAISWKYVLVCLLFLCNMPGLLGVGAEYGPLWSLSVEEQFYLVWPVVVRHVGQRTLERLCWALVLLTPVLRWVLQHVPGSFGDIHFKVWVLGDFFAAGALAACHVRRDGRPWRAGLVLLVLGTAAVAWQFSSTRWGSPLDHALYLEPYLLVFTGALLLSLQAQQAARTWVGKGLAYLGHISFGLYLVHQFLFDRVRDVLAGLDDWGAPQRVAVQMAGGVVAAVAVASLSRWTFEAWWLQRVRGMVQSRG